MAKASGRVEGGTPVLWHGWGIAHCQACDSLAAAKRVQLTRRCLCVLRGCHALASHGQVTDLAWSPDGYTLLAASSDGEPGSRLCPVSSGLRLHKPCSRRATQCLLIKCASSPSNPSRLVLPCTPPPPHPPRRPHPPTHVTRPYTHTRSMPPCRHRGLLPVLARRAGQASHPGGAGEPV